MLSRKKYGHSRLTKIKNRQYIKRSRNNKYKGGSGYDVSQTTSASTFKGYIELRLRLIVYIINDNPQLYPLFKTIFETCLNIKLPSEANFMQKLLKFVDTRLGRIMGGSNKKYKKRRTMKGGMIPGLIFGLLLGMTIFFNIITVSNSQIRIPESAISELMPILADPYILPEFINVDGNCIQIATAFLDLSLYNWLNERGAEFIFNDYDNVYKIANKHFDKKMLLGQYNMVKTYTKTSTDLGDYVPPWAKLIYSSIDGEEPMDDQIEKMQIMLGNILHTLPTENENLVLTIGGVKYLDQTNGHAILIMTKKNNNTGKNEYCLLDPNKFVMWMYDYFSKTPNSVGPIICTRGMFNTESDDTFFKKLLYFSDNPLEVLMELSDGYIHSAFQYIPTGSNPLGINQHPFTGISIPRQDVINYMKTYKNNFNDANSRILTLRQKYMDAGETHVVKKIATAYAQDNTKPLRYVYRQFENAQDEMPEMPEMLKINPKIRRPFGGLSEKQLSELTAIGNDIMAEAHEQHMSAIKNDEYMSEGYLPIQIKELAGKQYPKISFDDMVHRLQSNREIIQKYTDPSLKPFWVNLQTYFLIHTPKHCSGATGFTIPYLNMNPFSNPLLADLHFHMMSDVGAISKEVYDHNARGIMDYKPTC